MPATMTPALSARETWETPGLLMIGLKSYGYRCYPGGRGTDCRRIVRLYTDAGFGGDSYDVSFHSGGPARCTCADATFRGRECKHVRAIVALGLHLSDEEFEAAELDAAAERQASYDEVYAACE